MNDILDIIQKLFTIFGVAVGGAWAYFKFFKNRTYRPRLDIDLRGLVFQDRGNSFLLATVATKNVGLTNVRIRQEGTGLMVAANQQLPTERSSLERLSWNDEDAVVFEILKDHEWIEPNETVSEDVLVVLPNQTEFALKLVCRIVPDKKRRSVEWNAMRVIDARAASVLSAAALGDGRS